MMSDPKLLFTRRIQWQPSGQGYPTEAAQLAVAFGFEQLHLAELVAFTTIANLKSRAVMERLGMQFDSEFDHPQVPVESGLRRHVLYRLQQTAEHIPRSKPSSRNRQSRIYKYESTLLAPI